MSFSHDIKKEILDMRQTRPRYAKAAAYGLFLFGKRFDREKILLTTENEEVSRLFMSYSVSVLGKTAEIYCGGRKSSGKTIYACGIEGEGAAHKLLDHFGHTGGINLGLLSSPERTAAFLAGAFLACGNVTDPQKSYHLEFVVRNSALCAELAAILEESIPGVRISSRRGLYVAYYKECSQIEDILTLMGASRASLVMIDVEMIKEVRNRANRVTNCETANIDKLVGAASAQTEDINLIISERGLGSLPEGLREAAALRLENPELSLRELSALMPEPITRSGMHHRLEKLSRIASEIRRGRGGNGDNTD